MGFEDEISEQEGIISKLRVNLKTTRLPQRTTNWQHKNIGSTNNITQRVLIIRKQRALINGKIAAANGRIMSLRESILGAKHGE